MIAIKARNKHFVSLSQFKLRSFVNIVGKKICYVEYLAKNDCYLM